MLSRKNKKSLKRELTELEHAIMKLINGEGNSESMDFREAVDPLLARSKSEPAHGMYLTMLYLLSATSYLLIEKSVNSHQHLTIAIETLSKYSEQLNKDNTWKQHRSILEKMLNHYFVVLSNALIRDLRSDYIAPVLTLLTGVDHKKIKDIRKILKIDTLVAFEYLMKRLQDHIIRTNQSLKSLKNYSHYIQEGALTQSYLLYYALSTVLLSFSVLIPHIFKVVLPSEVYTPELEQNDFYLIQSYSVDFCKFLQSDHDKWPDKTIRDADALFLFSYVNRTIIKTYNASVLYTLFSNNLYQLLIQDYFKQASDADSILHLTQLNFDMFFEPWTITAKRFGAKPFNKLHALTLSETPDLTVHIYLLWQGVSDVFFGILLSRDCLITPKECYAKDKNKPKEIKEIINISMKYIESLAGISSEYRRFTTVAHHRFLLLVNDRLDKMIKSVLFLEKHLKQNKSITKYYIPLPYFPREMFECKSILPNVFNMRLDQFDLSASINPAHYQERLRNLSLLEQFYLKLQTVLACLIRHPEWFCYQEKMTEAFQNNIMPYIAEELIHIKNATVKTKEPLANYQNQLIEQSAKSDALAQTFILEEETKQKDREERRKAKAEKFRIDKQKKTVTALVGLDTITKDDVTDDATPMIDTTLIETDLEIQKTFSNAILALSNGHYYEAIKQYTLLGEISHDHQDESLEGRLVCHLRLLIKSLQECTNLMYKIIEDTRNVKPEKAAACYHQVETLQNQYKGLVSELQKHKQSNQSRDKRNNDFLQSWLQDLETAFATTRKARDDLILHFSESRYDLIMVLGFKKSGAIALDKQQDIYDVGYKQCVLEQKIQKDPLFQDYKTIYNLGLEEFHKIGQKNKDANHLSPFAAHKRLIKQFDDVLNQTKKYSKKPVKVIEQRTQPEMLVAISKSDFTQTMSAVDLLKTLRKTQFLTLDMQESVFAWVRLHPNGLADALCTERALTAAQAGETFAAWFMNGALTEYASLLDATGLLCWFLSIPHRSIFQSKEVEYAKKHLQKIEMQVQKTKHLDQNFEIILAQMLTAFVIAAWEPDVIMLHLRFIGALNNPIKIICDSLNLSLEGRGALHALLVTYLDQHQVIKPQHPIETVRALIDWIRAHNAELLGNADICRWPWQIASYGTTAVYAEFSTHPDLVSMRAPHDIDIVCTAPARSAPFKIVANPRLFEFNIYHRKLENDNAEKSISIRFEKRSIPFFVQQLDVTVNQIIYDYLLMQTVFCTERAIVDFQQKVITPIQTITDLSDDPQKCLRTIIASVNYRFVIDKNTLALYQLLMTDRIKKARFENKDYLEPLFDPGRLLHFLFSRIVYEATTKYIALALETELLVSMLPIPLVAWPLPDATIQKILGELSQFDHERTSSTHIPKDGWVLLADVIVTILAHAVLHVTTSRRDELLRKSIGQLENYLPADPRLKIALHSCCLYYEKHLALHDHTHVISETSVFNGMNKKAGVEPLMLQAAILPTKN